MTIQLELDPETEARLKAQAVRHGIPPERFAGEFLRDNLPHYATGKGSLTREGLRAMTKRFQEGSEKLPILTPEANERASYYEERR